MNCTWRIKEAQQFLGLNEGSPFTSPRYKSAQKMTKMDGSRPRVIFFPIGGRSWSHNHELMTRRAREVPI